MQILSLILNLMNRKSKMKPLILYVNETPRLSPPTGKLKLIVSHGVRLDLPPLPTLSDLATMPRTALIERVRVSSLDELTTIQKSITARDDRFEILKVIYDIKMVRISRNLTVNPNLKNA
jgi:hypothetical protein